ncbi:MAG TPA: hypothetical protein VHB98_02175 [Chloroflexota bacterium]|jgi:hypothetical protein|nr:hypothetical protein [Chloroflexota bacterium]
MRTLASQLHLFRLLTMGMLALILLALQPSLAQACSLDGIASISMNGNLASLTAGAPTAANRAHWASFTLLAAAPNTNLRLSEDLNKVHQALADPALKTPFRWSFDDGVTTRGFSVVHRFAQIGWHRVTVSYYWPDQKRWIEFDSAQVQIVPASELLKTNFLYYAGKVLLFAMRAIVWIAAGIIILAAVAVRLQRMQRRRVGA